MTFSEYGVAAPVAMIRTAARGDERYGPLAVMLAPGLQIAVNIYLLAVRPWLSIQILDQGGTWRAHEIALGTSKHQTAYFCPPGRIKLRLKEIFKSNLRFPGNHNVCACI